MGPTHHTRLGQDAGSETVEYGTIPGVELLAIGMNWPAGTGAVTITLEHLVDAMVAGNDDPLIRRGRVKLGHEKWQLTADGVTELGDHDPFWQGEPAFGSISNHRLTDDGGRLLGDLVEVPMWMVNAAPSAWPNRSSEIVWDVRTDFDVETEGGKRYSCIVTAIALLGVQQQAVKNLRDLQRIIEHGPEELVAA